MADLLAAVWRDARRAVDAGGELLRQRAADCTLVALCEAARSAADPAWAATARALAGGGPGPCAVPGTDGTGDVAAVAANGFLIHAGLADDAYRVAHHPGLTVVPAALAALADPLLPAVAFGYELSCRLADLLLPQASQRGWRITSVLAPVVAAGLIARVRGGDEHGLAAARLATGVMGGPVHPVDSEGDWRLQPALAAAAGVLAARAAATHRPRPGGLEAEGGPLAQFAGARPATVTADPRPRLPEVAFKRHGVAMYGQAVYDAVARLPAPAGPVDRMVVTVPEFAARYGGWSRDAATCGEAGDSVASVARLARDALAAAHPGTAPPPVEVRADDAVGPLGARVTVRTAGGETHAAAGSGDTRHWGPDDIARHCRTRTGVDVAPLASALRARPPAAPAAVLAAWQDLAATVRAVRTPDPDPEMRG
ncbi:MAG: hypothetical protein GEV12_18090 [Micromonosporaceae bacterium]|nr:hypothetical protein [Micromonosporaceae bacterium]